MQATRQQILDFLHREQRATVKDLAAVLGITFTGVRQHLALLEREGLIRATEERGRVGRPAYVYSLSDRGADLYPTHYDALANMLMEELRALGGADALQRVLKRVSVRMAEQYLPRLSEMTFEQRVRETVRILSDQGSLVETEQDGDTFYIRQCTCPYPNVARRNPGVCALEVDYVRRLTGGDARLIASMLRGDRACTYRIRPADRATPPASTTPAGGAA